MFPEVASCAAYVTCTSGTSVVLSEIGPLVVVENFCCRFLSPVKKISYVLSKKRDSSGRSPVARCTVRTSRTLDMRLLCPATADATTASKCSCLSPVGPSVLMGASLTWGSDTSPMLCSGLVLSLLSVPPCTCLLHNEVIPNVTELASPRKLSRNSRLFLRRLDV